MKKEINEEKINHLALYRKYRPKSFEDVSGQENSINILKNSIKENKISHAYLFSGSRGTGKTTVARIFAKEIGCNPDDIFELDAASNNGVDDIRLLIEAAKASTFGSKYKVYILDEVHMLSKAGANAFLKTLEEPPAHVIFILATTDKHKLPDTVVSRCQEIKFTSPDIETLVKRLKFICDQEGIKINNQSLNLIANAGNGSYRDAIGILEKVIQSISINNKKEIYLTDTEAALGLQNKKEILKIIKIICEKDIQGLVKLMDRFDLNNKQKLESFYLELVGLFELGLLIRINNNVVKDILCDNVSKTNLNKEEIEELKLLATNYPKIISSATLLKLLDLEKKISESSLLKESVLVISLINLIDEL
jgi:DNA polymerase-3 subunit gamma/tau